MSEEVKPKNKGGRPSKGKSGHFSFRVTAGLRALLQEQSQAIGRPVSEVIEARLVRSFEEDAINARLDRIEKMLEALFTPRPPVSALNTGAFQTYQGTARNCLNDFHGYGAT